MGEKDKAFYRRWLEGFPLLKGEGGRRGSRDRENAPWENMNNCV